MSLSGVFCHAFQPLFLPKLKIWKAVSQPVRSETVVTLMTLMGLAFGVEYAQKCLYKFCHYQTQSILLQASPIQKHSELEQQCLYKNLFVTLICCMGEVQKYTRECVSSCVVAGFDINFLFGSTIPGQSFTYAGEKLNFIIYIFQI